MSSQNSDVERVLGALGAPDMPYRSFASEPLVASESDAAAREAADPAVLFPLLASALPGSLGAVPPARVEAVPVRAEAVPVRAEAMIVPPPAAPVAAPVAPPPPPAPPPVSLPPSWPAVPAAPAPAFRVAAPPPAPPWAIQPAPAPAPAAPVLATPLERVFRILRGGAAPPAGGPAGRGLHDLFRRL